MTSIAVVVLDTLRYDRFHEYFSWLDGARFENAYSTSHWTPPAHSSLLTGRYPSEVGTMVDSQTLDTGSSTLSELLADAGYTTRMVANNIQIIVWDGWERGFEERIGPRKADIEPIPEGVFDWRGYADSTGLSGPRLYASGALRCFLNNKLATLRSLRFGYRLKFHQFRSSEVIQDRLFTTDFGDDEFLLVNVMDTHRPYDPPERDGSSGQKFFPSLEKGLAGEIDDPDGTRRSYDQCVSHLSEVYRTIFAYLREEFDYVITLADHGESLGEQGLWTHGYGLPPEVTHIPLVVSGDDVASETIDNVVSLLDVHQTVLDLAGVAGDSRGQNLLGKLEPQDRLIEYHGLAENRRKLLAEFGLGDQFEVMNRPLNAIVSSDGYAEETHDEGLQVSGKWSHDEARARLDALLDDRDLASKTKNETDVSEGVQSQLEYLGYA